MSTNQAGEGDEVSRNLNGSYPSGTTSEFKPSVGNGVPHSGNGIAQVGTELSPAAHIGTSPLDAAKPASNLNAGAERGENGDFGITAERKEHTQPAAKLTAQHDANFDAKPYTLSELDQGVKPDEKADEKADEKEGEKADEKEGEKADEKAGEKADEKADEKTNERADEMPDAKLDAKPAEPRSEPQDEKGEEKKEEASNGNTEPEIAQAGDKRKADEQAVPEVPAGTENVQAKKQKTSNGTVATKELEKEPGTSKGAEKKAPGPKKEKKVIRTGVAARKTRSQGAAPDSAL